MITLLLCAAAALFEGFDNQSMGVAAPRVIAEFGLTSAQSGVIFSAATMGLFVGAAGGGRIADHVGRRRTLAVALLLFGLFSLLTAVASGPQFLFMARLFTGLGLGAAMPNFISLASESVAPERRVSAVTLVMAGMPLGGALAGCMALGAGFGWSWRAIFLVGGAAPLLLGGLTTLLPRESSAAAAPATASETARGMAGLGAPADIGRAVPQERVAARTAPVARVTAILFGEDRTATTVLLWVGFFFTQLVLLLMLNWLPTLIIGLGFTRLQASLASIAFNVTGSLGAVVLGRLHAGKSRRLWVLLTYCAMAAALAAVSAVARDFASAALACGLAGLFIVGAQLILFALAPLYYRFEMRGTGVGAAVAMGRLGSVLGPLFAGQLLAHGGDSSTVLRAIIPFVVVAGGAAFALTWRRQILD